MKERKPSLRMSIAAVAVVGDLVIINLLIARFWLADARLVLGGVWPWALILSSFAWISLSWAFRINPVSRRIGRKVLTARISAVTAILLFVILLGHITLNRKITLSLDFLYFSTALLALLTVWNLVIYSISHYLRSLGYDNSRVVIAGAGPNLPLLAEYLKNDRTSGYQYVGYLADEKGGDKWLGRFIDLKDICEKSGINELFIVAEEVSPQQRSLLKNAAQDAHLQVSLIPDIRGFNAYRQQYYHIDQTPIIALGNSPLQLMSYKLIKRSIDIALSLAAIVFVFSWLGPLIMLGIRLSSRGSVFFRQKRTGYHNRTFTMLKYRTMVPNSKAGLVATSKGDPRVTGIGRILRRSSLDELPQLFNVLAGQMSLIGPRPHMLSHTEAWEDTIPRYLYRHHVKPGMTGLAQVRGLRGEVSDPQDVKARVEQDIYYFEHWSLMLDLRIALLTLWRIIRGDEKAY